MRLAALSLAATPAPPVEAAGGAAGPEAVPAGPGSPEPAPFTGRLYEPGRGEGWSS